MADRIEDGSWCVREGINTQTFETFFYLEKWLQTGRWAKVTAGGGWETFPTRDSAEAMLSARQKGGA